MVDETFFESYNFLNKLKPILKNINIRNLGVGDWTGLHSLLPIQASMGASLVF